MPINRNLYGRNLPDDVKLAEEALLSDLLLNGGTVTNISRYDASANLAALSTGVMTSAAIQLTEGKVVSKLTFVSATTAAGTPTDYWFALYDKAGALLGQTASQGSAAWAANTVKTLSLTSRSEVGTASLKKIDTNVATITTAHPHGLAASDVVYVSISDAVFDGQWVVASVPTSTTFTYARTNADVPEAAATGSVKKIVATPVTVPATGVYYAAVMVAATTPPTLAGVSLHNAVLAGDLGVGMKVLAQTSGSALAAIAPATIATPTAVATVPLAVVS